MFTTAIISFREFLEALLIAGAFLGVSRALNLKKETEIMLATLTGVVISLLLATGTYIFGDHARGVLTEKNADILESYLLIFSGLFIAYVVFSLHGVLNKSRGTKLINTHKRLQETSFDVSLFLTIAFLVVREGFEIALFTASTSLFSAFIQNFLGLLIGFMAAAVLGIATFFAYIKFPIGKIFKMTEYMIILLGASLVQNGMTKLLETHFHINLSTMLSLHLQFLPDKNSLVGHLLQGFLGIDQELSFVRLSLMVVYIGTIYLLFLRQKTQIGKLQ